jgi:hypothetical protein
VPEDMRRAIREYGPSLRHPPRAEQPVSIRERVLRHARASENRLRVPRRRLQSVVVRLRWWPIVALVIVLALTPEAAPGDDLTTLDTVLVFVVLPVFIAIAVWSHRLRKRRRLVREDLKLRIEKLKEEQLSPAQVEHEVARTTAKVPEARSALISDLVSSSFLDSDEFRAVENYIVGNPPALPREAKRSFNHAQLMTEIARARHMFGGDPELTPAHLAKWLVLREQCPAVARLIAREPQQLRDPKPGMEEKYEQEIDELLSGDPCLADVIERLVYFQPAENGRAPGTTPVS